MGDIHGSLDNLYNWIDQLPELDDTHFQNVITLGDVGLRYGGRDYGKSIRRAMSFHDNLIWHIMRGNHDDRYFRYAEEHPTKYTVQEFAQYAVENKHSNILYLPDGGGIRTIDRKWCLFIPGSYSVDKWYRLENGYPYNPDEQLTEAEMKAIEDAVEKVEHPISYVFSHTCPKSWQDEFKDDLFMDCIDQSKVDETMEVWLEEKILPAIEKNNPNYHWYFGHYHDDREVNEHATMVYHKCIQL